MPFTTRCWRWGVVMPKHIKTICLSPSNVPLHRCFPSSDIISDLRHCKRSERQDYRTHKAHEGYLSPLHNSANIQFYSTFPISNKEKLEDTKERKETSVVEEVDLDSWSNPTEAETDSVCSQILEECRKVDVTFYSVKVQQVKIFLQFLMSHGLQLQKCRALLSDNVWLLKHDKSSEVMGLLYDMGFSWKVISRIITGYGDIVDRELSEITEIIQYLQKLIKNQQKVNEAILLNPLILSTTPKHIKERLNILSEWFENSSVRDLIITCPSVLFSDIKEMEDKLNYAGNIMGIPSNQVVKSYLFQHSLFHIQERHTFLVRAGLFRRMRRHKGEKDNNPTLNDMLELSDKKFAAKYGGISELDYRCFVQYFARERSFIDDED